MIGYKEPLPQRYNEDQYENQFHSRLNAYAPPFDSSKTRITQSDDRPDSPFQCQPIESPHATLSAKVYPTHGSFPQSRNAGGMFSNGVVDHTCLQWDGRSHYFYNTRTREFQRIPFVPQRLTPLSDRPQGAMFLIKPEIETEDIHCPSYIKFQEAMIHKDRSEASRARMSSTQSLGFECESPPLTASNFSNRRSIDQVIEKHETLDRSTETVSSQRQSLRQKDSMKKCSTKVKKNNLRASEKEAKTLETVILQPLHGHRQMSSERLHARMVPRMETSFRKRKICKNLAPFTTVHYDNAGTQNADTSTIELESQSLSCSIPISNQRDPMAMANGFLETGSRDRQPRKIIQKCVIKSRKLISTKGTEGTEEALIGAEWIDTAPVNRTRKTKELEKNKSQTLLGKTKSMETSEFDNLLHCISLAKKHDTASEAKSIVKTKAENVQIHRDYLGIIEKADACRKNPAARILLLQQALPLAEQAETISEVNNQVIEMAELYIEVGEYSRAQEYADRVSQCLPKGNQDKASISLSVRCLIVMGRSYESLVQPDRAKPFFEEAMQLVRKTENPNLEASLLGHLGIVHELMGDYTTAFELYDKTLEMAKSLNDRRVLCETSANLGLAHLSIGELDTAERILMKNIPIARSLRDYVALSRAMTNVAHVQLLRGNLDMAAHFHEQEIEINEENQDSQGTAQALSCLGNIRKSQKKYEEATKLYLEELCIVQRLGNETRILESLGNCGTIYRMQNKLEKAREFHQRERQCAESTHDQVYLAKAILNLADVDVTESTTNPSCKHILLRTAIERYNRSLYLVCEGVSHEDRQLYMIKVGCCEAEWRALDGLETAYRLLGDGEQAIRCADAKHLSIASQALRASIEAQEPLETDKSPVHVKCEPKQEFPVNCHEKLSVVRSNVSEFLKRKFPEYNTREIMRDLGIDVLVLYSMFWEDGQELYAYIMHPSFPDWKAVPLVFSAHSSKVLASQRGKYRALIAGDELDMPLLPHSIYSKGEQSSDTEYTLDDCLTYLYEDFFAPLEDALSSPSSCETLCIVTDGLITNVPFSMLKDLNGNFLVERFAISTVPSLEQLVLLRSRQKNRRETTAPLDVLSLRYTSQSTPAGTHASFPETTKRMVKEVSTSDDLYSAVNDMSAAIAVLCLPTVCEMKDDYTGSFWMSGGGRVSSEDILEKWKSMRWSTVVCDGMSCFTYRVIHESTISLTRAILTAGADRIVGMHWLDENVNENDETRTIKSCTESLEKIDVTEIDNPTPSQGTTLHSETAKIPGHFDGSRTPNPLLEQLVSAFAAISSPEDPFAIAKALQRFQLDCIQNGISRWKWGKFTIVGLP